MGKTASLANIGTIADSSLGFRNRIINGAMVISQRTTSSVVSNESGQYPVDRFFVEAYGGGVLTSQQSSTAPAGFINSTIITVTTTDTSLGGGDDYEFNHKIEGFNVADLGWGTATASTVTLSFWVRSSVTGSYSVGFQNSASTRSYVGIYTINSANTWEQKSITVAGDTSGTWNTGNSTGLFLRWCLATGTNRVASAANTWEAANRIAISSTANPIMGTSGATFYITGVQLEKGSTATSFDYRPYGTELQLAQRYFEMSYDIGTALGTATSTGAVYRTLDAGLLSFASPGAILFKVTKRSAPTVVLYGTNTGATAKINVGGSDLAAIAVNVGTNVAGAYVNNVSAGSAGASCSVHYTASSEL